MSVGIYLWFLTLLWASRASPAACWAAVLVLSMRCWSCSPMELLAMAFTTVNGSAEKTTTPASYPHYPHTENFWRKTRAHNIVPIAKFGCQRYAEIGTVHALLVHYNPDIWNQLRNILCNWQKSKLGHTLHPKWEQNWSACIPPAMLLYTEVVACFADAIWTHYEQPLPSHPWKNSASAKRKPHNVVDSWTLKYPRLKQPTIDRYSHLQDFIKNLQKQQHYKSQLKILPCRRNQDSEKLHSAERNLAPGAWNSTHSEVKKLPPL